MQADFVVEKELDLKCYHCGDDCPDDSIVAEDKHFCCQGCKTVYEILQENDLCGYYDLNQHAGVSLKAKSFNGKFDYLDEPKIQAQLLDYQSETINKVTLYIPAVHCSSCVWLLENFHKIRAGVLHSRLNFLKKELSVSYNPKEVSLKDVVELLTTLGYEPLITLESSEKSTPKINHAQRRLIKQIAVTGFCAGNIMIYSFPEYFHIEMSSTESDKTLRLIFLYLNLVLSLPVFFFGASDYLHGAWVSLKEFISKNTKNLSVDIPIAVGIIALFLRSTYEAIFNQSAGYFDSLAGLVLFLLVGKWVQQKTFDFLSFNHQYKSYFPLAVKVLKDGVSKYLNVNELEKGDTITLHHQEIIPADSLLLSKNAQIDYSFVTGESAVDEKRKGEILYAGGRIMGEKIEAEVLKPVSQSYLTQLWNNDSFKTEKYTPTTDLANQFSKYFTVVTILISTLTAIYWSAVNPVHLWDSTVAVLMVACPCALTLSMPFTMNAVMVLFGKNKFYVRNQGVLQLLTETDTIVFDKTGTLTEGNNGKVQFHGQKLSMDEKSYIKFLTSHSTHPLSRSIHESIQAKILFSENEQNYFFEAQGLGIEGVVDGNFIRLGSDKFITVEKIETKGSVVHLEINREYRGYFSIEPAFRENWENILSDLKENYQLALLSGDNDDAKKVLKPYFDENYLRFHQKPQDKLDFIRQQQEAGHKVLMIGDGLNDAGALRQANVGIAISQDAQSFSPSCDAILDASKFERLVDYIKFSKSALNIVKISFLLSVVYNVIGIGWAVSGELSPVIAAIFMPLSSLSVVLFAVGLTYLWAKVKYISR